MTGTLLNVATVLVGGTLGMLFGARLPARVSQTVVAGIGLFTAGLGLQMFLKTENPLVVLGSLLVGGVLGEWWALEARLQGVGAWLEQRFGAKNPAAGASSSRDRFIEGFLTASLLFCVGPMTIIGAIQDGLTGDYNLLAIKSVLDGFAALAFASTLGVGVLFSTLVILFYQGGLSLLAFQAQALANRPDMLNEMTAAGGILLMGLAVSSLLEIKPIRVGNFLPALVLAPATVAVLVWLGVTGP